jgi:hypothetical protein
MKQLTTAALMLAAIAFSSVIYANDGTGVKSQKVSFLVPVIQLLLEDETKLEPEPDPDPEPEPEICTSDKESGVFKLNLDHVQGQPQFPIICEFSDVETCIEDKIRANIDSACLNKIDIFVPGTTQEGGDWKQFRKLVYSSDRVSTISMGYSFPSPLENALYDKGVIKSRDVLRILLKVLANEFEPERVRVFGHSKGSHGVALVADDVLSDAKYDQFEFYAFGQPGRTKVDIDPSSDIDRGRLGSPGYIEKLSDNLIGITWENDEVQDYTGDGYSGTKLPLSWRYPGQINGAKDFGSGAPLLARLDHHNTYGGEYTEKAIPYCATGSGFILGPQFNHRCVKKVDTLFKAYFWGNKGCRLTALNMMASGSIGDRSWIGMSGPRASSNSCAEKQRTVRASYSLKYRYNRADKDCIFKMKIRAYGRNSPGGDDNRPDGGTINLTLLNDVSPFINKDPETKRGNIDLPYNMTLVVEAELDRESGIGDCKSAFQTESYIPSLNVKFDHPGTGKEVSMELIDNTEGAAYPIGDVHNKAKTGWRRTSGSWYLGYDTVLQSLKIEGKTNTDSSTKIRIKKIVSLVD